MNFSEDTILKFNKQTRYDIISFIELWGDFVDNSLQPIISYYKGEIDVLDQESNEALKNINEESEKVQDLLQQHSESFNRIDFWDLVEYLETIDGEIKQYLVISRFLRAAKYEGFNEDSLTQDYVMTDFDTLESVAEKDRDDFQNEWSDIAIKNKLLEVNYVSQRGGTYLNLGKRTLNNIYLASVVDNLQGEKVYGLDIDNQITFESNDLKVLSYRNTFKQAVDVLSQLAKGDIPEYPDLGITKELFIGSNIGDFVFPFVGRELEVVFGSDDTILNFRVNDLSREGSTVKVDFELESFYNFIYNKNISIQQ